MGSLGIGLLTGYAAARRVLGQRCIWIGLQSFQLEYRRSCCRQANQALRLAQKRIANDRGLPSLVGFI